MLEAFSPSALPVIIETIPVELKACHQWVVWRYELRNGTWTKVLKNPHTGYNAKSDTPDTWGAFETALASSREYSMRGIGFVFSLGDPYAGVDLDKCRDPVTGRMDPWALKIVQELDSYAEVSPSNTGVKIFLRAKLPPGGNRKGQIECYDHQRYFTVTGHHLPETPHTIEDRQVELTALHVRIFQTTNHKPQGQSRRAGKEGQRPPAAPHSPRHLDNDALISRALAAKNGTHFAQLWSGDAGSYGSHSEADAALCTLLAFWTGPDPQRIDQLFRRSGLYRDKWEREDYRERTIGLALAHRDYWKQGTRNRGEITLGPGGLRLRQVTSSSQGAIRTIPAQEISAWRS